MRRQRTCTFTILLAICTALFTIGSRANQSLTFDERVKAQEAIERVYYAHRIWPKENPQPKPPFEEMVPKAVIEAKVTDYLKKCAALDKYWQRPIQPEQLQAEMDRMAKQSREPATLKELFSALGNDPTLIAECLARPILADRWSAAHYARDPGLHARVRRAAERLFKEWSEGRDENPDGVRGERVEYVAGTEKIGAERPAPTPGRIPVSREQLDALVRAYNPHGAPRFQETAEAFVVSRRVEGGPASITLQRVLFQKVPLATWLAGQRFEPAPYVGAGCFTLPPIAGGRSKQADSWAACGLATLPDPSAGHTAVWTGTEMIVWCPSGMGFRYDPLLDDWTPTSTRENAPTPRGGNTAVWTGTEMIIWGGWNSHFPDQSNSGARYDPATDTWQPTSQGDGCPSGRYGHCAFWTGQEMLVWGSVFGDTTGARYDPWTDSWKPMSSGPGVPEAREGPAAAWTGREMFVWSGWSSQTQGYLASGALYDPASDTWRPTSTGPGCPVGRSNASAVWTGTEVVVWGDGGGGGFTNTGGRYNPDTDTWRPTSTGGNCPAYAYSQQAVWTGTEMIVWGEFSQGTGGRYDPVADSWKTLPASPGAPEGQDGASLVWTGQEMIVWGGLVSTGEAVATGSRYDPAANAWTPVAAPTDRPSPRSLHTAIWTGAEMIVWGGESWASDAGYNGAKYDPATDAWRPMASFSSGIEPWSNHTAVWTGAEMIVWGGGVLTQAGGRYNPATDAWQPTSVNPPCPSPRYGHSAVWTGTEMIVWGGCSGEAPLGDGGRYDPSKNRWKKVSLKNRPSARFNHAGLWTGQEMLVWGGNSVYDTFGDGARYSPRQNRWKAMPAAGAPSARSSPMTVWTGSSMLVWGGYNVFTPQTDGARYDPASRTWTPMSAAPPALVGRTGAARVWTGAEMIVWGGSVDQVTYRQYLYDGAAYAPASDAWRETQAGADCPAGRDGHTAVWTGSAMLVWGGIALDTTYYTATGGAYSP